MKPKIPEQIEIYDLFGGIASWHLGAWKTVDDRVRGGSSQSHLTAWPQRDPKSSVAESKNETDAQAVLFWGTLDTQTLGGAGFASQQAFWSDVHASKSEASGNEKLPSCGETGKKGESWNLGSHDGIVLEIELGGASDGKRYVLGLQDRIMPKGKSGLVFEGELQIPTQDESELSVKGGPIPDTTRNTRSVFLPWHTFHATYRGSRVRKPRDLRVDGIVRVSLMMRSFFQDQEDGDFQLVVRRIGAYRLVKRPGAWWFHAREHCRCYLQDCWNSLCWHVTPEFNTTTRKEIASL